VKKFKFLGKETLTVNRQGKVTSPGQVLKLENKGLFLPGRPGQRSDLYVRINVEFPDSTVDLSDSSDVSKKLVGGGNGEEEAALVAEDDLMVKDRVLFKEWNLRKEMNPSSSSVGGGKKKKKGKKGKEEL